jgi:hypothetical protein
MPTNKNTRDAPSPAKAAVQLPRERTLIVGSRLAL